MIELNDLALSGHCHKVGLFLSLLELEYRSVSVNGAEQAHQQPDLLCVNPCSMKRAPEAQAH
ncbi:hypothetical protein ACW73L_17055 [Methylolobus aquaticus]